MDPDELRSLAALTTGWPVASAPPAVTMPGVGGHVVNRPCLGR